MEATVAKIPSGEAEVGFREGWVKYLKVSLSSAGGAAVMIALFGMLQRQPVEGFGLLAAWGPWPFVVLLALAMLGRFMSRMNDTIQTTFSAVVTSVQQGSEAQAKTADALTRLAEQGGRHAEEVERVAIYAAQELGNIQKRFDRQEEMLNAILSQGKVSQ